MDDSTASEGITNALSDPKAAGTALLRQGKFAEAAAVLREAAAADPNDEAVWSLLGGALASQGEAASAVEAFRQSATLSPTVARNQYNLALALQSAGRLPEAKAILERALTLDPAYEQARTRLAEIALQLDPRLATSTQAVPAEGYTNIAGGSGSDGGLASIGGRYTPTESTEGYTNIGGSNSTGLSSVGAGRDTTADTRGHTNIGGSPGGVGSLPPDPSGSPILRPTTPAPGNVAPSSWNPQTGSMGVNAPPPVLGMAYAQSANTSGMQGDVPAEISGGFNGGAFFLTFLWLLNHRLVAWGIGFFVLGCIPYVSLLTLPVSIYVGVIGNRLGWQNRRFDSIDDFKACQRIWLLWGIIPFIVSIILIPILLLPVYLQAYHKARGF